jgi:signal transduction histidine kinase
MHDVLAHRLSLLSVHAGALEYRPDAPPDEIARAAGVIRASAHTALQELREVIGLLREGDENGSAKRPLPTLADVPGLIAEARESGMRVREAIELDLDVTIPDVLGRTVFRIVQEGLTNARKHAPGSLVEAGIRRASDKSLEVAVVSRPPVGATLNARMTSGLPGTGTGLIGLAERATLSGGQLRHGPSPDGGYILQANFPWPS